MQLTIQGAHPKPAIAATPFLGGLLHGAFEHLVRYHAQAIATKLGMTKNGLQKNYAVLPPPYGWQVQTESENIYLGCGIMLFSHAQQYAKVLIDVLQKWQEIRLEGRIDKI